MSYGAAVFPWLQATYSQVRNVQLVCLVKINSRQKLLLATLALTALTLLLLVSIRLFRPPSRDRLIAEGDLSLGPSKGDFGPFTNISNTADFPRQLQEAIRKLAQKNDSSMDRAAALTQSMHSFLVAFHSGDIDAYWRFRNPTKRKATSGAQFAQFVAYMRNRDKSLRSDSLTNPAEAISYYWQQSQAGVSIFPNITSCVTCVEGVALERISIFQQTNAELATKQGMTSYIRKLTGKPGATIYEGLVAFAAPAHNYSPDKPKANFTLVFLPLALKSGAVARLHVLFQVEESQGAFVPIIIGAEGSDTTSRWLIF